MPLIKYYQSNRFPLGAEVSSFEILKLQTGDNKALSRLSPKEIIFLCKGICEIVSDSAHIVLSKGECFDIVNENIIVSSLEETSILLRISGKWKNIKGSSGVFELKKSDNPGNIGDQNPYERNTEFDNHFHDCDEYWFIIDGKGTAVTEGTIYEVEAGDCIYTRKGDHHDFPMVYETIHGVYFETSLSGRMRTGHLWNHTHGN